MKKYNTIINYIEPTKILQRVTVDTFNNTYPLGHEYSGFEEYVSYEQYPEANADNAPEINAPSNLYYKLYDFKDTIDVKAVKIKTGVLYTGSGLAPRASRELKCDVGAPHRRDRVTRPARVA